MLVLSKLLNLKLSKSRKKDDAHIALLESTPRGYSADLLVRVNAALKANDVSFGIADMAKPPAKKVFPKIGKGAKKTLVSKMALEKVKSDLQEALNTRKAAIDNADHLAKDSEKFIAKWEKENGGHFCMKKKCKAKDAIKKPPIPGATFKPKPAAAPAKVAAKAAVPAVAVAAKPAGAPAKKHKKLSPIKKIVRKLRRL